MNGMNASNPFAEFVALMDAMTVNNPQVVKLVMPRRYVPPQGYINPKVNALSMVSHLACNNPDMVIDKSSADFILLGWKLCEAAVPTIFVAEDFLTDLMMTDVPEDFPLKDFLWPHEAMVFALPLSFQLRYFGRYVPFVRIGRSVVERHRAPQCVRAVIPQHNEIGIDGGDAEFGVIICGTVFFPDRDLQSGLPLRGVDYTASYPEGKKIGEIVQDTIFNNPIPSPGEQEEMRAWSELSTPDEDIAMVHKICTVTLQLLLALNAMPEHLEAPELLRPERIKQNRDGKIIEKKEALWKPRLFGGNYVIERRPPQGGTHASPRMHRRRGHRRIQRDPITKAILKWIWIKPCWVGAQIEPVTLTNG